MGCARFFVVLPLALGSSLGVVLVTASASAEPRPRGVGVRLEYERGPHAQKCPAELELRGEVAAARPARAAAGGGRRPVRRARGEAAEQTVLYCAGFRAATRIVESNAFGAVCIHASRSLGTALIMKAVGARFGVVRSEKYIRAVGSPTRAAGAGWDTSEILTARGKHKAGESWWCRGAAWRGLDSTQAGRVHGRRGQHR
jgi:hypothetical protein